MAHLKHVNRAYISKKLKDGLSGLEDIIIYVHLQDMEKLLYVQHFTRIIQDGQFYGLMQTQHLTYSGNVYVHH